MRKVALSHGLAHRFDSLLLVLSPGPVQISLLICIVLVLLETNWNVEVIIKKCRQNQFTSKIVSEYDQDLNISDVCTSQYIHISSCTLLKATLLIANMV